MVVRDIYFQFGPEDSYFLRVGHRHRSAGNIAGRRPPWTDGERIRVDMMAWNKSGSYCSLWYNRQGNIQTTTAKLNPKLERAMSSSPRSARRVVFGPEATWFLWYLFGCSPEYSAGLPKAIEENVQDARKMYTTLRCVALGPENNFVMIWQDGSKSYNLDENYSVLNQALDSCEGEDVSRIALNPNKAGDYFVYFDRTKTAMFQVSEAFGKDLEDALTAEGIRSTAIVRHRDKLARQTDILKMAKQSNLVGNVADTVNNETIGSSGSRLVTNGVSIGASLATFASAIVGVAACTVM